MSLTPQELALRVRCKIWDRQLPKVIELTDYDERGVYFEAIGPMELRRIVSRGSEQEYLGQMLDVLEPEDVLYDVGANIGLVGIHAARRCRTIAFEPDPSFYSRLRRNLELNPDVNVDAQQTAVSDTDGTVRLFTDGNEGASPSLIHQRDEKHTVEVSGRSIDSLVEREELPAPTVIKLDIEGAEILALKGAERLLHGSAPPRVLLLEVHDSLLPGFGSSADEVVTLVRDAGYNKVIYEAVRDDQQHLILGRS